jgi:hypothetical protein
VCCRSGWQVSPCTAGCTSAACQSSTASPGTPLLFPPPPLSLSHPLTRSTLASDNILGLTAVVANGHVVRLTASTCTIDGVTMPYGEVRASPRPDNPSTYAHDCPHPHVLWVGVPGTVVRFARGRQQLRGRHLPDPASAQRRRPPLRLEHPLPARPRAPHRTRKPRGYDHAPAAVLVAVPGGVAAQRVGDVVRSGRVLQGLLLHHAGTHTREIGAYQRRHIHFP